LSGIVVLIADDEGSHPLRFEGDAAREQAIELVLRLDVNRVELNSSLEAEMVVVSFPDPASFLLLHGGPGLVIGQIDLGDCHERNCFENILVAKSMKLCKRRSFWEVTEWIWQTIGIKVEGVGKFHDVNVESTIACCLIDEIKPVSDVLESDQDLISFEWEGEILAFAEASKIK
jgi:hypothetical protein